MKTKPEIRDWILANCVDEYGYLDLSDLDFSGFNVTLVDISGMKVACDLHQHNQKVGGVLRQDDQEVKGDLWQSYQTVGGDLGQGHNKVEGDLWQDNQTVSGKINQMSQKVKGDLHQSDQEVGGDLLQSFQRVKGSLSQSYQNVERSVLQLNIKAKDVVIDGTHEKRKMWKVKDYEFIPYDDEELEVVLKRLWLNK